MNEEELLNQQQEETPPEITAQQQFLANLRNKYADKNLGDDDDAYYKAAMDDYDVEHEWAKETRKSNEELAQKLQEDPYVAGFIGDILAGKHPRAALENFPTDFWDLKEGDEGWDKYTQDAAARKQRLAEEQQQIADYDKNIAESKPVMEEYARKTGRTPEQMTEFFDRFATEIIDPIMRGQMTEEMLSAIDKAFGYEEDIKRAEEQGRIAGKNESVLEKYRRMKQQAPDLPTMDGSGGMPQQEQDDQKVNYFRQLAEQYGNNNNY